MKNAALAIRQLRALLANAQEDFDNIKIVMLNCIENTGELSWDYTARYTVRRERLHLVMMYFRLEPQMSDEQLLDRANEVRDIFLGDIIRNSTNIHTTGDMNSTDAFSRAISAAKISAKTELLRDLISMLGE